MGVLEIVEAAWYLDPNERVMWSDSLRGMDEETVAKSVVALQAASSQRPSIQLFMAHYRAMAQRGNLGEWFAEQREKLRKEPEQAAQSDQSESDPPRLPLPDPW